MRGSAALVLVLLGAATLGGRIAEGDLTDDPVIYAALARDILRRHEWGTLYLAGLPFFDKPPLVPWLAALSFRAFGVSVWSARLPAVAAGILACVVLWRLGSAIADQRVGLAAGAILALTPGFMRFGSRLFLDPPLVLATLSGFLVALRAWEREGRGLWLSGGCLGVAFMAKGALALAGPAVLAAFWITSPAPRRPPFVRLLSAGIAFVAVVAPWHAYEVWRWGWRFVDGYVYDVASKLGGRPGPGVYLSALASSALPWLPVAAVGAWRVWRSGRRDDGVRLLTVWTLVGYGFLLTAGKHSPRYLMVVLPALALWAGLAFEPVLPERRRLTAGIGALALVAWTVVFTWPRPFHSSGRELDVRPLAPYLGAPGTPVTGYRLSSEQTRGVFAFYLGRDVRWIDDVDALARLPAGSPVVASHRCVEPLASDRRFERVAATRDYLVFRVRSAAAPVASR